MWRLLGEWKGRAEHHRGSTLIELPLKALLILGIYNTAWIWYKLVLSWRDRPLS